MQKIKKNFPADDKNRVKIAGTQFVVDQKYQIIKQIGSGAYGVVVSALDTVTNKKFAIKKVVNAFEDLIDAKRILREIRLLKFFKHENIISITDLLKPQRRTGFEDIYIITELMETDLHRVIYSRQEISVDHVQYFTWQILKGLAFIHSANVIHRDLKPGNLLLNKNCLLKICDFGLARGFEFQEEEKTEYVVTRWYRAPQVILNASQYSKAIDVWSVGCIVAELLGRTALFPGEDFLDQVQRIISVLGTPSSKDMRYISNEDALKYIKSLPKRTRQKWQNLFPQISPQLSDLLTQMLQFDPQRRISAEQALKHPFFDGISEDNEPIQLSKQVYDWSWDNFQPTKQKLQNMVYEQSLVYHPQRIQKPERKLMDCKNEIKKESIKEMYRKYK